MAVNVIDPDEQNVKVTFVIDVTEDTETQASFQLPYRPEPAQPAKEASDGK